MSWHCYDSGGAYVQRGGMMPYVLRAWGGRGLARAAAHCSRQSVWARAGPEQSSLPEVGLEVPLSPDTRQDHPQLERFPFPNTPIALDCRPSFLFRSSL